MTTPEPLSYVAGLIAAHAAGHTGDHMHLGWFAPQHDECDDALGRAQTAMAERHLHHAAIQDDTVVIDIGCGLGGTLRMLNERQSGTGLIGVNIDPRQLAVARHLTALNGNSLEWIIADAAAFARPGLFCDTLLSVEAMFHFPDMMGFLQAVARVLRPGGRAVISTILLSGEGQADLARSVAVVARGYAPWPLPGLTLPQLLGLIDEAGLDLILTEDLTEAVAPTFDIIAAPPPKDITPSALTEMRRLLERGGLCYVLLVLQPRQAGGNTQK
jgi:cyclopropane fatty-acyl-phospholipid synthase-like methyltransferase